MEQYICPECGTDMVCMEYESGPFIGRDYLLCSKCNFIILKSHYDFIHELGKHGAVKLPPKDKDRGKRKMSVPEMIFHAKNGDETPEDAYIPGYAAEKPPLGCPPHYTYVCSRIEDLCNAIVRCYADWKPNHNKIALWCKEIMYLNEMDRNLRYEEKQKVWKEDKHGNLQEMP